MRKKKINSKSNVYVTVNINLINDVGDVNISGNHNNICDGNFTRSLLGNKKVLQDVIKESLVYNNNLKYKSINRWFVSPKQCISINGSYNYNNGSYISVNDFDIERRTLQSEIESLKSILYEKNRTIKFLEQAIDVKKQLEERKNNVLLTK